MATSLGQEQLIVSRPIVAADAATTMLAVEIPANTWIPPKGVSLVITTALSGGTPSWDVGDADDADGWISTTDITESSAGTYTGTEAVTDAFAATGKLYTSAGQIKVVVTTGLTTGSARVYVRCWNVAGLVP